MLWVSVAIAKLFYSKMTTKHSGNVADEHVCRVNDDDDTRPQVASCFA